MRAAEQWVKDRVKKQRESGEEGIEIKKQANSYYVYRSTTYWDKKAKRVTVLEHSGRI
ncbi:MAG: hypothetical protein J7I99_00660 [Methanophagales archaeon]|nr:hypothetical protein [Methanophagales archaeon]